MKSHNCIMFMMVACMAHGVMALKSTAKLHTYSPSRQAEGSLQNFASVQKSDKSSVLHAGEDCWAACGDKAGYCSFCGQGNACCRRNWEQDPSECNHVQYFSQDFHHQCVAVQLVMASVEVRVEKTNQIANVSMQSGLADIPKAEKTARKQMAAGTTVAIDMAGNAAERQASARAAAVEKSKKLAEELARAAKAAKVAADKAAEELEAVVNQTASEDQHATKNIFRTLEASSAFSGQSQQFSEKLAAAAVAGVPASTGQSGKLAAMENILRTVDAGISGQHKEVIMQAQSLDTATHEVVRDSSPPAAKQTDVSLDHRDQKDPTKNFTEVLHEQRSSKNTTKVDASPHTEASSHGYVVADIKESVAAGEAEDNRQVRKSEEVAHPQEFANKSLMDTRGARGSANRSTGKWVVPTQEQKLRILKAEASTRENVASAVKAAEVAPNKIVGEQASTEKNSTIKEKIAEKMFLNAGTAVAGKALETMASVAEAAGKKAAAEKLLADKIEIDKRVAELAAARRQALLDAREAHDSALESMGKWVVPTQAEKSRYLKAIEERRSMEQHRSTIDQAAWQARIEQEEGTKIAYEKATASAELASTAADREASEAATSESAADVAHAGLEQKDSSSESVKSATKPGGLLQAALREISGQNALEAANTEKLETNMTRAATNLTRAAAELMRASANMTSIEATASRVASNLTSVVTDALRVEANMTRVAAKTTRVAANVTRMEAESKRAEANRTDAETEGTSESKTKAVTTVTLRGMFEITLCTITSFFVMFFFARRHKEKGEDFDFEEIIRKPVEHPKNKPQLPSGSPFNGLGSDDSLEELQKFIPVSEPLDEFFDAVEAETDEFAEAEHEAPAPPKISSWRCQCSRRQQKPHAPVEHCCGHLTWEVEYQ